MSLFSISFSLTIAIFFDILYTCDSYMQIERLFSSLAFHLILAANIYRDFINFETEKEFVLEKFKCVSIYQYKLRIDLHKSPYVKRSRTDNRNDYVYHDGYYHCINYWRSLLSQPLYVNLLAD